MKLSRRNFEVILQYKLHIPPYFIFRNPEFGHTVYLGVAYSCHYGRDSSVGIATSLPAGRSGDRIPVGARFSAPVQTGPGAHPASCTMGTGSFPGVKSGRGVVLPPTPIFSAEVLNWVELYLYPP